MQQTKAKSRKLIILISVSLVAMTAYIFLNLNWDIIDYSMKIRGTKLIVMFIAAFCIGSASVVFQSLINNTIVTPCLLGMNALYILIHTCVVFVLGSTHTFVVNKSLSFGIDLVIMCLASFLIYGFLFRKTKGNVLYILLAGSVIATLFSSITSTMQRVMDPNDFDTLQNSLIASFNKVNSSIIIIAIIAIGITIIFLWRETKRAFIFSSQNALNLTIPSYLFFSIPHIEL